MKLKNEAELEGYVRKLIADQITKKNKNIYALENKKAVDILICRDGKAPALFFLEVKYHQRAHGRLGFGSGAGGGFQPEIVSKRPRYFEERLRWILASEEFPDIGILFVDSETIRSYVSGGEVGQKFNNIQKKIFDEVKGLNEQQLVEQLSNWLKNHLTLKFSGKKHSFLSAGMHCYNFSVNSAFLNILLL